MVSYWHVHDYVEQQLELASLFKRNNLTYTVDNKDIFNQEPMFTYMYWDLKI